MNLFVQRHYWTLRLSGCAYFGALRWCFLAPAAVGTWRDVVHLEAKLWEQQHHCDCCVALMARGINDYTVWSGARRTRTHEKWEGWGGRKKPRKRKKKSLETLPSLSSSPMQTWSYRECQRKIAALLILTWRDLFFFPYLHMPKKERAVCKRQAEQVRFSARK